MSTGRSRRQWTREDAGQLRRRARSSPIPSGPPLSLPGLMLAAWCYYEGWTGANSIGNNSLNLQAGCMRVATCPTSRHGEDTSP